MDMNDDDIDLVDDDELLDEEDLKKPDPASLRGTIKILSCLHSHMLKTHLKSTFIYSKTGVYRGISVHKFSYLCSLTSIVGTHWKGLRRLVLASTYNAKISKTTIFHVKIVIFTSVKLEFIAKVC